MLPSLAGKRLLCLSSALRPRVPLLRSLSSAAPLALCLTQSLTEWKEVLQPGGIVFALLAAGAMSARYFVDTRVAAKMEALTLQMASQSVALEALSKAVDAKNAVIQKNSEVDAKTAGVQKEVDAQNCRPSQQRAEGGGRQDSWLAEEGGRQVC